MSSEEFAATTPDTAAEIVTGRVLKVVYRNRSADFGVLQADPIDSPGSSFSVVGPIPLEFEQNTLFSARGRWQTHQKFGRQFRAWSLVETDPVSTEAIRRYLASGLIEGIGPKLAERIVAAFGEDTIKIIDTQPERLLQVSGVGKKKFAEIQKSWIDKRGTRQIQLFFHRLGIPPAAAQRILQRFGLRSVEVVTETPYVLYEEVRGIGFVTADAIAMRLQIAPDSFQRIQAALAYILERAADDGHTYLTEDMVIERTMRLLGLDAEEKIRSILAQACTEGTIIRDGDRLYDLALFSCETSLAQDISTRLRVRLSPVSEQLIGSAISEGFVAPGDIPTVIKLSAEQSEAVRIAANSPLMVITGGPGCGKTTVVRAISQLFRKAGMRLFLAAPTGRAAQRLAEVCDMESSTIHRLLKFAPDSRSFVHNRDNPLTLDAIIVDESSMIDLPLAAALFAALPQSCRVIIVGDKDQLPSVGPGLFLADLLATQQVPRVELTNLFRRSNQSLITTIAHQINSGEVPEIPEPDGITKTDAYFLSIETASDGANLIERLVTDQIPKKFGFSGSAITVLAPMNQGELGVIALNKRLQDRTVPITEGTPRVQVGPLEFRLGDRVCQRVNNYTIHQSGVFNGDQGEVIGIDAEAKNVYVKLWDGREVTYTGGDLTQLDLAYAISIHRSQGSEIPAVVLALHDSHTILLERQLLYTAITRAKRLLIIVGTRKAFVLACKRTRSQRRLSGLVERIRGLIQ